MLKLLSELSSTSFTGLNLLSYDSFRKVLSKWPIWKNGDRFPYNQAICDETSQDMDKLTSER
jgi:hypothetical protein